MSDIVELVERVGRAAAWEFTEAGGGWPDMWHAEKDDEWHAMARADSGLTAEGLVTLIEELLKGGYMLQELCGFKWYAPSDKSEHRTFKSDALAEATMAAYVAMKEEQ